MKYRHFTLDEFACKCGCGGNEIRNTFVHRLDELRDRCRFPFIITSGWRCENHEAERDKDKPGFHYAGTAADIRITDSRQRYLLISKATQMGFSGIGIHKDFIHLDDRGAISVIWVYE